MVGLWVGWWECCSCYRQVNAEIWGDECPDCPHLQCEWCYPPGYRTHSSSFRSNSPVRQITVEQTVERNRTRTPVGPVSSIDVNVDAGASAEFYTSKSVESLIDGTSFAPSMEKSFLDTEKDTPKRETRGSRWLNSIKDLFFNTSDDEEDITNTKSRNSMNGASPLTKPLVDYTSDEENENVDAGSDAVTPASASLKESSPINKSVEHEEVESRSGRISRSSSVASIPESVFSIATVSSQTTVGSFGGASEELAQVLIEDSELRTLWHEAAESIPLDRLQRNVIRLLQRLAVDLKGEVFSARERLLARFVRAQARHTAYLIRVEVDVIQTSLGRTDPRHEAEKGGKERNGEAESESEDDENEIEELELDESTLLFLQLKEILVNSLAFETFRVELKRFIRSAQEPQMREEATEVNLWNALPFEESAAEDVVQYFWQEAKSVNNLSRRLFSARNKLLRNPPVVRGMKRITWRCRCGKAMYDDYEELEKGAAKRFQRELRNANSRPYHDDTTRSSRIGAFFSSILALTMTFGRAFYRRYFAKDSELPTFEMQQETRPPTSTSETTTETERLYLLLCMCDNRRVTTMRAHQLPAQVIESDRSLFHMLQTYYVGTKSKLQTWLSLWALQKIHFVHFDLYEKALVDIRALHAVPPDDESASYMYERVPLRPPIGSNLLMHLFHCHEDASALTPCLRKIPKKRREVLSACPVKGIAPGWGLCFHEEWSVKRMVTCSCVLVVLASVVASVLYWRFEHSVQDALALGTFVLTCAAIGIGTLQVWLVVK